VISLRVNAKIQAGRGLFTRRGPAIEMERSSWKWRMRKEENEAANYHGEKLIEHRNEGVQEDDSVSQSYHSARSSLNVTAQ